jgi:hypothetical protein
MGGWNLRWRPYRRRYVDYLVIDGAGALQRMRLAGRERTRQLIGLVPIGLTDHSG